MTPAPPQDAVERFTTGLATLAGPAPGTLAIAVSGGPDSLALLLFAAAAAPGRIVAATVDHGLRAESAAEAAAVADICATLGVPHRTLNVSVPSGGEGLQASARAARYAALGAWMRETGARILLTGHHADDQAETLVMRLLRGSGVAGLAGVRARSPFAAGPQGSLLCRPLLGWRRDELAAIVAAVGIEAADDASNGDEAYDRVRIRRHLSESAWIDAPALARSAAALADAEEALDAATARLFEDRVRIENGTASLDPAGLEREFLRRLVLRCLRAVAPEAAPRGEQLGTLLATLAAGGTATLAGVKCTGGPRYKFEPAPARRL
jgi:tRNA(Ile)-lysidine synthase